MQCNGGVQGSELMPAQRALCLVKVERVNNGGVQGSGFRVQGFPPESEVQGSP